MPRGCIACATEKPIAASKLDGSVIQEVLDDAEGFTEVAEGLFENLDVDEDGKISRSELEPALLQIGYGLGVPTPGKDCGACLIFKFMASCLLYNFPVRLRSHCLQSVPSCR